jgi:hypothetical protein
MELTVFQKFCKEALIWKNLDHDYILPFIGVDSETFPGFLCMVSPWMSKGALVNKNGGPCGIRLYSCLGLSSPLLFDYSLILGPDA